MFFYHFSRFLSYIPLSLIYPTKTIGAKNIPKKQAVIFACNHRSNVDVVLIGLKTSKAFNVLAKQSLFKNKFSGAVLKSYGAIPVDRDNVSPSVIKTVLKGLKNGKRLVMFPEGTRNDVSDQDSISAKNGVAMFAIKTHTPVVPMWIVKKPKAFKHNTLLIGKPFELTEFYEQKLTAEVLDTASKIVSQKMQELRDDYLKQQQEKKDKKQAKKQKKNSKSKKQVKQNQIES